MPNWSPEPPENTGEDGSKGTVVLLEDSLIIKFVKKNSFITGDDVVDIQIKNTENGETVRQTSVYPRGEFISEAEVGDTVLEKLGSILLQKNNKSIDDIIESFRNSQG